MTINGKEYTEEQIAAALAAQETETEMDDKQSKIKSNIKEGLKIAGVVVATAAATIFCKDVIVPKVFGKTSHDNYYDTDDDTIDL